MRYKIFIILLIVCLKAESQNDFNESILYNSPYSRFGVGLPIFGGNAQNTAMGRTYITTRTNNAINSLNPASYTAQDTMSFIFNISLINNYSQLAINNQTDDRNKFFFNNISIAFPIQRWLKTSIGIKPISTVGYQIEDSVDFGEYGAFFTEYQGYGSINSFYIGNAIEIGKNLSLGINLSYLFGSIGHKATTSSNIVNFINHQYTETNYFKGLVLNTGLQYYRKLGDDINFSFGVIYDIQKDLNATTDEYSYKVDTTYSVTDSSIDMSIPSKIGIGLAVEYKNKITASVEYSMQDWTGTSFRNYDNSLTAFNSINLGFEYVHNKYSLKRYSDHIRYRMGAFSTNTYFNISGQQVKDVGITAGLGFPINNAKSMINVAYEYGKYGPSSGELLQDKYSRVTLNLVLYDFWFIKRKFD